MKKLILIGAMLKIALSAGFAQAAEAESDAQAVDDQLSPRASSVTDVLQRGQSLSQFENVVFFNVDGAEHWLVSKQANGVVRGTVLLIGSISASANGAEHLAALRRILPDFGWHTYFVNARADIDLPQLITASQAHMAQATTQLVVCEAQSCDQVLALGTPAIQGTPVSGAVFINVPYSENTWVDATQRQAWLDFKVPALVLAEHPQQWPQGLALTPGYELHLLPAGQAGQKNSRVLRKMRGWLKRRLKLG